jgi:hypothetical protein
VIGTDVVGEVKETVSKLGSGSVAVDDQGRADYSFAYSLVGTTSNSATFGFDVGLRNPMSFSWDLGDVSVSATYTGIEVARSSFNFALKASDYNTFRINASIHGNKYHTCMTAIQ